MDLPAPLRSLNSDTQARVLTVLAAAERPLAGNAVARRTHLLHKHGRSGQAPTHSASTLI